MKFHNFLSLPHLPVRYTTGRLVDYSQSHVVTLAEYLIILQQKIRHGNNR